MKRFMAFILAFVMVIGSVASAAPGDIIHTGNKKVYKPDSQSLVDDIINGVEIEQFYREVESNDGSRKFVNIVDEENNQFAYIEQLVKDNNLTSPEELAAYLESNKDDINTELERITNSTAKDFDLIPGGGSLDDYFGSSKASILKTPDNYSTPVPGYANGTTKIVNLTLPKGASSWIYNAGEKEFADLEVDTVVEGTKYNSGTDIKVELEDHLLLGAVDGAGKLKAYASIEILDTMIKKPKVEIKPDSSINLTLDKALNHSGATKVSGVLGEGNWNLAVLSKLPGIVYEDSKFNEFKKYENGMEIIVATENEIDNGLENFEKYIIIYEEKDEKVIKYNTLKIEKDNVSDTFNAPKLKVEDNYSNPIPGGSAGTTKIDTLTLEGANGASEWMYVKVENASIVPKLDRVYANSNPYEIGQSIKVSVGDYLMILATDNSGKVRAYDTIEVEAGMVKNPLATELKETTHYTKPVKGGSIGSTKFEFLKYDGIESWIYRVDDTVIDPPELGSTTTGTAITLTNTVSGDISVEANLTKLKEDIFRRYVTIYGLDSHKKIQVYKNFTMNDTNVRMPEAEGLENPKHYSGPKKGNNANTTRIESLAYTNLPGSNLKFKYKVVNEAISTMEFNHIIEGTSDLRANADIPVTLEKHLLILVVDGSNKTKAFTTVPLTFDNVKAGNATLLQPTTNYVGPVPGAGSNSTKFTFLNEDSKFIYKLGDTSFGIPESGSVVEGGIVVKQGDDIIGDNNKIVAANKYLLLLAVKEEDSNDKVIAYREFRLLENQIKGGDGTLLVPGAYGLIPGDKPSTTRLKLEPLGLENPNSIIWRYKLVSDETYKPYFNEIVDGTTPYTVNSTTKIGPDISVVKKADSDYGIILILATDSSGRTKAYEYEDITDDYVKEHAHEIVTTLEDGTIIDSVKFNGLTDGNTYKYLISNTRPATPAIGDTLPNGVVDYTKDGNITAHIGKYLSLYEVDNKDKILKFTSLEVEKVKQGSATLTLTPPTNLVEGNILNGGPKLTITLTDAEWADLANDKSARDKFFNGFKADSEVGEWTKVINSMISDGKGAISIDGATTLTILLPETPSYDIKEEQKISLTIPYEAIKGALNPIEATGTISIKPTVKATISGDVVNSIIREDDIKAGGKTIVIELADGAWAHDVSKIINGFSSSGDQWNTISTKVGTEGKIVRNSSSKITITLPPVTGVDFGTTEVISLTIPMDLIQGATEDVVASPKFSLYPNRIQVEGEAVNDKNTITLTAPDYRIIDTKSDTWIINVSQGKLNETITDKDLIITGLPRGLVPNVSKVSGQNQIQIKLTGTASATLPSNTTVKIKIKGTAVTEPNSVDSEEIGLKLVRGGSIIGDLEKVEINVVEGKLLKTTSEIVYSLDSTNGTNGTWSDASSGTETVVSGGFKAGKVYVRDKDNIKVFHLVATLSHPKAPTGISISEVNYSEAGKVKIKLDLPTGINYDYSVDGGKNWDETFVSSNSITLDSSSDLRIRLRATKKELASLATTKIIVLDLSAVSIDVGNGVIKKTTNAMEYSLDDGVTYATARVNETPVKFENGAKIVVRQRSMANNFRNIGTEIVSAEKPETGVSFNVLDSTITDSAKHGLQYRIGNDPWKDLSSDEITTTITFKPGQLEVRAKGSTDKLPSDPVELGDIKAPASAPEVRIDDFTKNIEYRDDNAWKNLKDANNLLEYQIDNNKWNDASTWDNASLTNSTARVSVRFKATDKALSSLIKTVNFTGNLTFDDVELNVVEGKIKGTTTAIQYSINSNDGKDGTWTDGKAGSTAITFVEGMKVYIREKTKPLNFKSLTLINGTDNGIGVESEVDPDNIGFDISQGSITNKDTRQIQFKIGNDSDPWQEVEGASSDGGSFTLSDVVFKSGALQFRSRGTNTTLPSSTIIKATIKAKSSAPELKYDDVEYKIEKIGSTDATAYEYSINGGTSWIEGTVNSVFEGGDVVLIRLNAKSDTLASNEQKITFSKNLDLTNVILNAGKSQLENTSNLMEYSLDSTNGENGQWLVCTGSPISIQLKEGNIVYIREKAKPRHFREVTTGKLKKKELEQSFVDDNLSYNVLEKTISFNASAITSDMQEIVNNLQYRIGTGNWVNIDYITLETGVKVLAYNVNFSQGNLEFRLKGDENTLSSDSMIKTVIKSPISAPNVSEGFDLGKYKNKVNGDTTNVEYSFGANGPWISKEHLANEDLVGNVYIRIKATANQLPSLIKELIFTPVLNLKTINLSTHVDPHELNGTTTQMEYNTHLKDTSTGWITCTVDNTIMPDWLAGNIIILNLNKIEVRDKNQIDNVFEIKLP